MAIDWFKPSEKLPEDGQECLLIPPYVGTPYSGVIRAPLTWSQELQAWIDGNQPPYKATVDQVGLWTDWGILKPPAETAALVETGDG